MLKFFSSSLQPDEFVTKLKSFVDEEEIDPDSPTQFTGGRPVIGRFDTRRFTLHRRVGIHWILWWLTPGQWFKPYLNGNVTSDNSGSRIELTGGTPILIKILWVLVLLGGLGSIALWTMFSYPYNLGHDPAHSASNFLGGIVLLNLVGRDSGGLADRWLAADPVSSFRYRQRTAAAPGFADRSSKRQRSPFNVRRSSFYGSATASLPSALQNPSEKLVPKASNPLRDALTLRRTVNVNGEPNPSPNRPANRGQRICRAGCKSARSARRQSPLRP